MGRNSRPLAALPPTVALLALQPVPCRAGRKYYLDTSATPRIDCAAGGMPPISSYRAAVGVVATRVHSYLWIFLLPAAAECTASVWFPSISYGRLDLQLAVLNVSGALLEGFFAAWEAGTAVPSGPISELLAFIADDMRGSFLSTYTSWAGMVGFAAALTHSEQSLSAGVAYMAACVLCAFFAHALGQRAAEALFAGTKKKSKSNLGGTVPQNLLMGALISYIVGTYMLVLTDIADFEDSDAVGPSSGLPALLAFFDAPHRRLLVRLA